MEKDTAVESEGEADGDEVDVMDVRRGDNGHTHNNHDQTNSLEKDADLSHDSVEAVLVS